MYFVSASQMRATGCAAKLGECFLSSLQSPIRRHTDRWRDSKVGLWRRYSPRELTQEWAFPNKTIKLKAVSYRTSLTPCFVLKHQDHFNWGTQERLMKENGRESCLFCCALLYWHWGQRKHCTKRLCLLIIFGSGVLHANAVGIA